MQNESLEEPMEGASITFPVRARTIVSEEARAAGATDLVSVDVAGLHNTAAGILLPVPDATAVPDNIDLTTFDRLWPEGRRAITWHLENTEPLAQGELDALIDEIEVLIRQDQLTSEAGAPKTPHQPFRRTVDQYAWERRGLVPSIFDPTRAYLKVKTAPPDWMLEIYGLLGTQTLPAGAAYKPWKSPRKPLTPLPGLFEHGTVAPIPSDKYTRAITGLIRGISPFEEAEGGYPVTVLAKEHLDTKLIVRHLSASTPLTQEEKSICWTVACELGDYEADLLRISLALYAHSRPMHRDQDGYICIPIDIFLDARGIVPITEGGASWHRSEDKRRVVQALRRLAMLRVEVIDTDNPDAYIRETSVLMMDVLKAPEDMLPVQVEIKPGRWRDETAGIIRTPQLAPTSQWVYKFDPVRERWEKRLSEYISDFAHIDKKTVLRREIGVLLGSTGTGLWQFHDANNPGATRQRFERAMNNLVRHNIIAGWEYTDQDKVAGLPKYKWIDKWRLLMVDITIDSKVATANIETGQRSATLAERAAAPRKRGRPRKSVAGDLLSRL